MSFAARAHHLRQAQTASLHRTSPTPSSPSFRQAPEDAALPSPGQPRSAPGDAMPKLGRSTPPIPKAPSWLPTSRPSCFHPLLCLAHAVLDLHGPAQPLLFCRASQFFHEAKGPHHPVQLHCGGRPFCNCSQVVHYLCRRLRPPHTVSLLKPPSKPSPYLHMLSHPSRRNPHQGTLRLPNV